VVAVMFCKAAVGFGATQLHMVERRALGAVGVADGGRSPFGRVAGSALTWQSEIITGSARA